jgi:hypothetical protein
MVLVATRSDTGKAQALGLTNSYRWGLPMPVAKIHLLEGQYSKARLDNRTGNSLQARPHHYRRVGRRDRLRGARADYEAPYRTRSPAHRPQDRPDRRIRTGPIGRLAARLRYADQGPYAQSTLRANRRDLEAIELRQRVGIDVDKRSLRTTIIGETVELPLAIAPIGLCGMMHRISKLFRTEGRQS